MAQASKREPPQPTSHARPFWDAIKRHELMLPRCKACGQLHYYPRSLCPMCFSKDLEWVRCTGRGKLYSYVINHRPAYGFGGESPNVIAVVELEEGPRMMGTMSSIGPDPRRLRVNMPVEVIFHEVDEGPTTFTFRPAGPEFLPP